eukprot:TRINITY_DN17084_c0_g1_i1.p1 TRINITY_DN17084_c0_g1~~TRINITY_DN17084_c0_g1_i1.p1  ORF type:complete len:392 (+),score=47.67 TRINITY_DN17084_c0_g1_i1:56-1231(+)
MSELYLVHEDGRVQVYSRSAEGGWLMTRMPPHQIGKIRIEMCHGPKGWHIKEDNVKIVSTRPLAEQDPKQPPLGPWRGSEKTRPGDAWHGNWTLRDSKPDSPPLNPVRPVVTPFLSVHCNYDEASCARVDVVFHNRPIVDKQLEEIFTTLKEAVEDMARRPEMTMIMQVSLQDACVPSMRHVQRLIKFSNQIGDLLFLIGRGNAIVLKPSGFFGSALVSIIRMIQAAAPPPWPETIVPTIQEAEVFLTKLRPKIPEKAPKHERPQTRLPSGAIQTSSSVDSMPTTAVSPTDSTSTSPISAPYHPSAGSRTPCSKDDEENHCVGSSHVPYTSHLGLLSRVDRDDDEEKLDLSAKNTKLEIAVGTPIAGSPGARNEQNWWNCILCSSAGNCGR